MMARNKRSQIIIGVALWIMLVALITTIVINKTVKMQRNNLGLSAELARVKTYDKVEEGEEAVEGTENVKFDAFFLRDLEGNGYATGVRGTCKAIGEQDTLYMEINVQTAGHLKDAKITIDGKNFYLQTALPKDEQLANSYIGEKITKIEFNELKTGTQKLLTGIVKVGDFEKNINNYSMENSVVLTGTYVAVDGTETPIRKEVTFMVDWYGTTRASISTLTQNRYIDNCINEEEGTLELVFTVNTSETQQELMIKSNHVEGEIPELNGYEPISVVYTDSNAVFNYDETTRRFTVDRTGTVQENGAITTSITATNSYGIKVTYPIEAYQSLGTETVQIKIPVKTYYEGYNNPNTEFDNPYRSNTASSTITVTYEKYQEPTATIRSSYFEITVGKLVSSPTRRYIVSKQKPLKIYNGQSEEEKDDTYTVMWRAYVGTKEELGGIVMKETTDGMPQITDQFIKTNDETESTDDVVSNVGIYFLGADTVLGAEGEIRVYDDETGNLLETFTKDNWNKYTSSNPYKYEIPVKHIRIETSNVIKNEESLYVYNIKEIDDEAITTKYEKEEFDELSYIKSTLVGSIGTTYTNTLTHQAKYEAPISIATIDIDTKTMSTQYTEENVKITVSTTVSESQNLLNWKDGTFLIKFPEEMIDVQVNNVSINNTKVQIENYEVIEQDGQIFIKIVTNNITPQSYTITIDADLTPDPRISTVTKSIALYATNEEIITYYSKATDIYDVNNNLNTTEQVNYGTTTISMVAPNSLLTNQEASNYDEKGSVMIAPKVADIRPIYAVVDYEEPEEQTAQIGIQIRNNYANTISEIAILGKIPFKGNTYVISGKDLGSIFTTKMTNTGIEIPEELKDIATIYYSENENPNKNINDETNNWKTADQVENWDNIKTFLIDLGDYVMPTGKEFLFRYTVKIPNGLEFNKVAYSHHGVYFCLDTDKGKYETQTEPNKIGFRIAEKYDLELLKYQTGKEKLVPGATYSITEIDKNENGEETQGEIRTATTNEEGKLEVKNLYAGRTYEIKEIKTPDDYELNYDVIRFIGNVDEYGILTIDKELGTTKENIEVIKNEEENYKISVKVEDEVKATIKITKKEQDTENIVPYARYKITGYNLSDAGKIVTTNIKGEATIKGLSIGQEYTLTETKAPEGYYLEAEPITFKIVNNGGNFSFEIISGNIVEQAITESDSIPTINITVEDEKIPTYELEITKIKKTVDVEANGTEQATTEDIIYLAGAKFKIYKDNKEIGEYISDENGKIVINNLYQYVEGKDENATYTLKEVFAPDGYAKVKDITFKVEEQEGLVFINLDENESKYTIDGNTVKLTIEDSPSFKLIKKDGETGELLANIKFAIYNVEDGEEPARNSKGEILGTKEVINGKEYYIVSTDINGEITADLPEGLYKAVEVQAPDKYDISNNVHYFGIGGSREPHNDLVAEWGIAIGGSSNDYIYCMVDTSDGGYAVGGSFESSSIDLGNGVVLTNSGLADGMIIKYGAEGEIEWARAVGGINSDQIICITETSDGGCIVGGKFNSSSIDLGNGVVLTNHGITSYYDGMIIKYGAEGEVEWGKAVGGSSRDEITCITTTSDGGCIVGGNFNSSSIDLENGVVLSNGGMIIKYGAEGEVEWGKTIGDNINCIVETRDGGFAVGGYFSSSTIDLGNGVMLKSNGGSDGMIIKYGAEGEVEWGKAIGGNSGDRINCITETRDGGFAVGGYFQSNSVDLGNGVVLTNNGSYNGMIIKYSEEGKVEWANTVKGDNYDEILCISETRDGKIVVGEYSESSSIDLGNGVVISNSGDSAGVIIKYDEEGNIEYAKIVGEYIECVTETQDGGYIIGGQFWDKTLDLGNGVVLSNSGNSDIMIIKYELIDVPTLEIKQTKQIKQILQDGMIQYVQQTTDGGYIVVGYFYDKSLDLGNGVVLKNNGDADGIIIKYDSQWNAEWGQTVGGRGSEQINSIIEMTDGGYIVGGYFYADSLELENGIVLNNYGYNYGEECGMIIKYDNEGNAEWAKGYVGSSINSITGTKDGGFAVTGYVYEENMDLGNGIILNNNNFDSNGMIIKYDEEGNVEWGKVIGGSDYEHFNSIVNTSDGGYVVGGYSWSESLDLGNGVILKNDTGSDVGIIIKYDEKGNAELGKIITYECTGIVEIESKEYLTIENGNIVKYDENLKEEWKVTINGIEKISKTQSGRYLLVDSEKILEIALDMGVPEVQELIIENTIKRFKISTEVKEVDGVKGGNISGAGYTIYEQVEYGENSRRKITITPEEKYEIMEITVNGKEYPFIANEDGTYTMPRFENMTENKHIAVTFVLKENKITINKIDEITRESLTGAKFRLEQIDERAEAENAIGAIVINGQTDIEIDKTDEITGVLGELTDNGKEVYRADTSNEVKGVLGELTRNGTYCFVEQDGKYIPTNGATYQLANGGTAGVGGVIADSYIKIDLTDKEGQYVVVVNAQVSSQSNFDCGYATITETNIPPNRSNTFTGVLSGEKTAKDYESEVLEGGKTYYLHLAYSKSESIDAGDDQIVFNSIKIYKGITYNFVEQDGKYIPTNGKTYQVANGGTAGKGSTTANSYIEIDLTGKEGQYAVVVNAEVSSQNHSDVGYATITETTEAPSSDTSIGRFIHISGTRTAEDYTTILEGGKVYYLHLGYSKNNATDAGDDQIVFNSIKVYKTKNLIYGFINNNGKYEPNNRGTVNTVANSYIPIDLTENTGKYNLTINAQSSIQLNRSCGYVTITEGTTAPSEYNTVGRLIYTTGEQEAKDYTTVLQGGKMYYLHLGYVRYGSTSTGEETFTINSIEVTLNDSELYHTEVETNSQGQAITQLPFGKYRITEIKAPEGYRINEQPLEIEFTANGEHEFTIENQATAKVKVHHYKAIENPDGSYTYTEEEVAESDLLEGEIEENYTSIPHLDISKYELLKDENGEYVIPENATGKFTEEEIEVIYYYVEKGITLTVHHYIEGTGDNVPLKNGEEAKDVIIKGKENEAYTTEAISSEELGEGYELVEIPSNAEGIYTGEGIEVTYYYRKLGKVIVHYYIEGTEEKITLEDGTQKEDEIQTGRIGDTFKTIPSEDIPEYYECISSSENTTGTYAEETQEVIYYYKIKEYNYTVEYYYDEIRDEDATETIKATYKSQIEEYENKEKEGYKIEKEEGLPLTIEEDEENNIIRIYYVKRNDLKYTVNYLEKGTNREIYEPKVEENQEFEKVIKATEEVIEIEGYKYDSSDKESITIGVDEEQNVINIYYTKQSDFTYTVNYLEKDTNKEIYESKIEEDQEFEKVIEASDEIITIEGYVYDSCDKESITIKIDNTQNVINIYYTKRNDLKYIVNYLDEDTNEVLYEQKEEENQEYQKVIETSDEIIDIEGYEYSSSDKDSLTIGIDEEENVINIYYIKRSDLKYTVNYLEKDTGKELYEQKVAEEQVYGGIITTSTEIIEIEGYNYDSCDKDNITIKVDETENVINLYYTIKTDIKYKVEYYYNGEKDEDETEEYEATYKDIIEEYEEKIREGYVLIKVKGIPLTIEDNEDENTIEVYYAKETTVIVKYIDKTTNEILDEITEEGYVGKEISTEAKDFENYVLVEEPEDKKIIMTEDETIIRYYYVHVSRGVIEKHIDIDTNEILANSTYEGKEGDEYKTEPKEIRGYDLVEEKYPENAEGTMERDVITVNYYYKKKASATVTIKYIDRETNEEIEENVVIEGYEGEEYKVEQKQLEGYELIEIVGEQEGTMIGEKEVIYYYQRIQEPEIPGEGGDDPIVDTEQKQPQIPDQTISNQVIPSAGLTKEQIAMIVVIVICVITGILATISIKGIKLDKKH